MRLPRFARNDTIIFNTYTIIFKSYTNIFNTYTKNIT